jgi:hypothetical protein
VLEVASVHDQFSWQLLAAALNGDLDLEALTELQIAWKAPQTAELLGGPARPLALRSLWTIREAARALPDQPELAALAAAGDKQSHAAADAALAGIEKDRSDLGSIVGVIYAALANPEHSEYRAKALPLLNGKEGDAAGSAQLQALGRVLLGQPTDADHKVLAELIAGEAQGSDAVVLTALACRKAGGDQWNAFRAGSRDLLGGQPLPGDVVALVNRLGQAVSQLARANN